MLPIIIIEEGEAIHIHQKVVGMVIRIITHKIMLIIHKTVEIPSPLPILNRYDSLYDCRDVYNPPSPYPHMSPAPFFRERRKGLQPRTCLLQGTRRPPRAFQGTGMVESSGVGEIPKWTPSEYRYKKDKPLRGCRAGLRVQEKKEKRNGITRIFTLTDFQLIKK